MSIVPKFTRDVFANIKQGARDATVILLAALGDSVDDVGGHIAGDEAAEAPVVVNGGGSTSVHISVNDDEVVVRVVVG